MSLTRVEPSVPGNEAKPPAAQGNDFQPPDLGTALRCVGLAGAGVWDDSFRIAVIQEQSRRARTRRIGAVPRLRGDRLERGWLWGTKVTPFVKTIFRVQ